MNARLFAHIISFANVSLIDVIYIFVLVQVQGDDRSRLAGPAGRAVEFVAVEAELHAVDVVRRLVHAHRGDSVARPTRGYASYGT